MWNPAPDQNVQGLLSSFAPFNKLTDYHDLLAHGAMTHSFDEWAIIPADALEPGRLILVVAGEIVLQPQSDTRKPISRISKGGLLFFPQASATAAELVATAPVTLLMLPPSASALVGKDAKFREAVFGGPLRPEEIWFACAAEASRRGIESTPAFHASLGTSVLRTWPQDAAAITKSEDYYIWIVAVADGQEPGAAWNPNSGSKWARLIGFPSTALKNCKKLEAPKSPAVSPVPETSPAFQPDQTPKASQVRPPPNWRRRKKLFWQSMGLLGVATLIAAAILWSVPVRSRIKSDGVLVLDLEGHIQPLKAEVAGEIIELKVGAKSKIEAGSLVAILKPPLDEARITTLTGNATAAREEKQKILRVIDKGGNPDPSLPPALIALVNERKQYRSDLRVSLALENQSAFFTSYRASVREELARKYGPSIIGTDLDADELKKFNARREPPTSSAPVMNQKSVEYVGNGNATDDRANKRVDVNEAQESLQAAQEQHRLALSALAEAKAALAETNKFQKKAAQDNVEQAQRSVGQTATQVGRFSALLAARHKELKVTGRGAPVIADTPQETALPIIAAEFAEANPGLSTNSQITDLEALLAERDAQIRAYADRAAGIANAADADIVKLKLAAEKRDVVSKFSGTIEAPLTVGSTVAAGAPIAQVITDFHWKANFVLPREKAKQIKVGTEAEVQLHESQTRLMGRVKVPPSVDGEVTLVLQGSGEDHPRGGAIHTEFEVITGNLLTKTIQELFR